MKKATIVFTVLFMVLTTLIVSCEKESNCYDEALYQQHKDDFCTMDCPGIEGCDGKTYCNECIANTQGIRKK